MGEFRSLWRVTGAIILVSNAVLNEYRLRTNYDSLQKGEHSYFSGGNENVK